MFRYSLTRRSFFIKIYYTRVPDCTLNKSSIENHTYVKDPKIKRVR